MKTTKLSHRVIIIGLINVFVLLATVVSITAVTMTDFGTALLNI